MNEKIVIFIITLIAEIFLGIGLIVSIFYPNNRLWPLPKKESWHFWYMWITTESSTTGFILLGIIDWDTLFLFHWLRFVIGSILLFIGVVVIIWGIKTLNLNTSSGLKGKLITNGPYKYSRNPQYIGIILAIIGYIIISNSFLTFITGLLGIILFTITPYAEEPWLREQFKKKYEDYCKKVPRFI